MAHIVFDLSSSESRSRFRELAADMLDLHDGPMSERFLARLKAKAHALELAALDFHAIMLELLRASGGCGFVLCDTGIRCPACNGEQDQVAWLCAKCGGLMIEDIAIRQREADRLQRERQELEAESKRIAEERSRLEQNLCDLDKHKQLEIEMVAVPGGTFYMGKKLIRVQNFKIGKYPVTQGIWKTVMDSNPSHFKINDRHPVENVSYDDVQQFVNKLSRLTDRNYRLPTEEEWEYAACSGGKDEIWAGIGYGLYVDDYLWSNTNSCGSTQPVGLKKPNGLGVYDMSGNVWEWCNSSSDGYQVLRGGSWYNPTDSARNAYRNRDYQGICDKGYGFRLAHD